MAPYGTLPDITDVNSRRFIRSPRRRTGTIRELLGKASSCFRVGLTRLVNEQDIRTPQHIKNRARNDPGILATDMKSVACGLSSMRVMCLEYGIRN
jgi:hypothetical protein